MLDKAGKAKMKPVREAGVLDHVFAGAGMEWKVYVRIIPNQRGATVTWAFIRPTILTDGQFEKQMEGFDREIALEEDAGRQSKLAIIMASQELQRCPVLGADTGTR